ncbi:hypothetical protein cypCar_00005976 [Cyprinus carpio]|uniref:Uncharacterized protein perm1 n=2 Tax=Cyprinus carpio TaxID=7962 RepID=A0A8C1KFS5_CYPCA|nr:uncharacterized protein perm1 [Cyprinus carpio]KTG05923.1 hypothetical protein cypCar_00005976 [Cyprinus carpio]
MDDLDHSVLIAEQDWDCFCTESEECSVQQAKLAALDETGFSDTDDDKTFVHVSSVPTQTSPDQPCEEDQIVECKLQHTSENSEFTEYPSPNTEPQNTRFAEQMSDAGANEPGATYEDSNLTEKLNLEKLRGNCENKLSQATNTPVSEISVEEIMHEKSIDGIEMLTEMTDWSTVAKKEKERWFVTVNDSPVHLRVKDPTSVQKKRRRKKPSKNRQNTGVMKKCSSLNNNTEPNKETTERQITQEKFEQENISFYSPNIQNVLHIQDTKCILPTGSSEGEEEKTSCPISLKKEIMTEMPEAKLERKPANSLNSLLTAKQMPPTIFKDLTGSLPQYCDHKSAVCDKYDKSVVENCECQHTTDHLIHFNNDTEVESPRFMLGASKPADPSDTIEEKTEQQEPLGKSYNREEFQETQSSSNSAKTSGPTPPIFAISSFWDELEKLTINDILQLRTANNKTETIIPEESSPLVTVNAQLLERGEVESKDDSLEDGLEDDAADSDYFTHLDDSKPDRSSCEFSTYSDFDEEFLPLLHLSANPSPEPLEVKEQTQRFLESGMDSEETWRSQSNEMVKLCPESDPSLYLHSEKEAEMQDIFLKAKEDENMNAFLLDHCGTRRSTPSPVLSISDILDNQCLQTFFEILGSDTKAEQHQTWIPDRITSLCFSQNSSVAETYDDFFSDFEVGNFLFPSIQVSTKSEKTLVPIYSSSHSVVKDLEYTEVEEVIPSDCEDENVPIRVMRCAKPSESSNICFITRTWRNLSLRRTKLLMGRTWCRMATSWGFPKKADTVYERDRTRTTSSSIAQPKLPELFLENQALGQVTEHQIRVGETVADADRDRILFSLKQTDMCLVCIAFASWVLKSSNPQSTDMWKAALLANVSAISAIQYLRRYVKEG